MASIYPITVAWLPTFSILGHSNADGWGAMDKFIEDFPDFCTAAGNQPTDAKVDPENAFWKNIYVFTSPQPFPGSGHTPVTSNVGDGEWLEMTSANVRANGDPHPHAHPFNYPNIRGSCYPRYYYNAWDPSVLDGFHHTPSSSKTWGTLMGLEVPLAHLWRNYWNGQVGFTKTAYSSTLLLPAETGANPVDWLDAGSASQEVGPRTVPSAVDVAFGEQYAYWNPRLQFDFSPATDRLFKQWYDKMVGAAAALPDSTRMNLRLVVLHDMGDNDSALRDQDYLEATWEDTCRSLIQKINDAIDLNGWSQLPGSEVTKVWVGIYPAYENGSGSAAFCNSIIQKIARDDPRVIWVDNSTWELLSQDGYAPVGIEPSTHFGHTGYVTGAPMVMQAFVDNQFDSWFDAISERDRMTLGELKSLVRVTYDRGRTQSDLAAATIVDFANQSLRSMTNHLGQLSWWLERRVSITLEFDSAGVASLPRYVAHLVKIEHPQDPKAELSFQKIGRGDGGRLLISMEETCAANSTATYTMAVISWPPDLAIPEDETSDLHDGMLVPFPKQFSDWLALEVCMRIASSGTNIAAQGIFMQRAQAERLRCQQVVGDERATRRDAVHRYGQGRVRLTYGRGR